MAANTNARQSDGSGSEGDLGLEAKETIDVFARVKGTSYAGLAGFRGQAKENEHGGFFKYPGKVEREGANFESEFKLGYNESTVIVIASDIEVFTCHAMPVKWMDKFGKPEYKWQRCAKYTTKVRDDGSGFDLVALPGTHKCMYCEDQTFGNTPRAIAVITAYTTLKKQAKNGTVIGSRLVYLTLTDRDLPMLQRLGNDMVRYGISRKTKAFPNGTLVGMKYAISRGPGQQSRSTGEAIELIRGEDDRPDAIAPDKFLAWVDAQVKQGKFKALNINAAYPIATIDEQKLLLRNAQTLNDKYSFVKGGGNMKVNQPVNSGSIDEIGKELSNLGDNPVNMDDELGLNKTSMSKLKDQIRKERAGIEASNDNMPESEPVKTEKASKPAKATKAKEDEEEDSFEDEEEEVAPHAQDDSDAFEIDDDEEEKPKRKK